MSFRSRLASVGLVWQFAIAFSVMTLVAGVFLYTVVRNYARDTIQTSSAAQMSNARAAVFSRIDADLALAENIVMSHAALARHGRLPLDDEQHLSRFFLEQILEESSVDYFFFANEQGGIASGGAQFGEFRLVYTKGMKRGLRSVERVDASGALLGHQPPPRMEDYDPRERAWYQLAKKGRRLAWGPPSFGSVTFPLTLALGYPLLGPSGDVQGVFGADVLLDSLGGYLETHRTSPNAHLMLLEPDGTLVANSSHSPLFSEKSGEVRRLKADTVPQPLSRQAMSLVPRRKRERVLPRYRSLRSRPRHPLVSRDGGASVGFHRAARGAVVAFLVDPAVWRRRCRGAQSCDGRMGDGPHARHQRTRQTDRRRQIREPRSDSPSGRNRAAGSIVQRHVRTARQHV
jgi:hypothetical protein